jgi:hypothetical protein
MAGRKLRSECAIRRATSAATRQNLALGSIGLGQNQIPVVDIKQMLPIRRPGSIMARQGTLSQSGAAESKAEPRSPVRERPGPGAPTGPEICLRFG